MRILHLNTEKTWRGGERQTLLLAGALSELGIKSVVGCRRDSALEQRARAESTGTLALPSNTFGAVVATARIARKFDLVHCHTGRAHSIAAFTAAFHRRPFIVTRRVSFVPKHTWFNVYKYAKAAFVACISRFISDQLEAWGVAREKLAVVRSAVPSPPMEWLLPSHRELARATLGIPPGHELVGNIGALVGEKDHTTFLRAAEFVVENRPQTRFVIIGEGRLRPALERLRSELGIDQYVLMPGFIPKAERLLPAFDVFAMSSCMEGLGSIVLDAFSLGIPVAATAGGGLPESVRNLETGLLVPVGDHVTLGKAVLRLLQDRQLAARLSDAARIWVQQECSIHKMAKSYLELYKRVLGQS